MSSPGDTAMEAIEKMRALASRLAPDNVFGNATSDAFLRPAEQTA